MSKVYIYNPETDHWVYDEIFSIFLCEDPDGFYDYLKKYRRGPKTIKTHDRCWRNCFLSVYETNITNLKFNVYQIV
jgi:hypothetical protein